MKKHSVAIAALIELASYPAWGQRLGDYYLPIPTQGFVNGRLKFFNDSTVEISNRPTHMSGHTAIILPYKLTNSGIEILEQTISSIESQTLIKYGMQHYIKSKINLTRTEAGFIDYSDSIIYVRAKDFRRPLLLYIIDGRKYVAYLGENDSYGLIKKNPKRNRRLEKRLAFIAQHADDYSTQFLRGLNAYRAVGQEAVFGVMIIKSRKPLH